jgi:hypothetical protein
MEIIRIQNSAAQFIFTKIKWMMKHFNFKRIEWPSFLSLTLGITLKISWELIESKNYPHSPVVIKYVYAYVFIYLHIYTFSGVLDKSSLS